MKRLAIAITAAALLTGTAHAAPPSDEQLAEFYKTCVGISQNETLCSCKREVAPKLLDADFMAVVISSMKGKAPPSEYDVPYNDYIAQSNAVCIPGY
jgi:hypothetical protein